MYRNERLRLTGILMAYCCSFSRWILFPWEKPKVQDLVEITPARPHHTTVQLHGYLSFPHAVIKQSLLANCASLCWQSDQLFLAPFLLGIFHIHFD